MPGSTARRLLSGSAVPVAIAPRGYSDEPQQEPVIGVGFDGGLEAEQALAWAAALADDVGGRLRLVAVHQPIAFANVSAGAFPTESVGQALRRQLRDEVEEAEAPSLAGPASRPSKPRSQTATRDRSPRRRVRALICWCSARAVTDRFVRCYWAACPRPPWPGPRRLLS